MRVLLDDVNLYFTSVQAGSCTVTLSLVNFLSRAISVEHVEVSYWQLAGPGMQDRDTPLRASGEAAAHAVGPVTFSITLHPADVSMIGTAIEPSHDPRSCPDVRLALRGRLLLNIGRRRRRLNFEVNRRIAFSLSGDIPGGDQATEQENAQAPVGEPGPKQDYSAYRDRLVDAEPRAQQAFDRTVMALSSGALGVSFAVFASSNRGLLCECR